MTARARQSRHGNGAELAASITHTVMQPIAAGINDAQAALRWLDAEPPNLEEAGQPGSEGVTSPTRQGERRKKMGPNRKSRSNPGWRPPTLDQRRT
jgi:hypothetical protein